MGGATGIHILLKAAAFPEINISIPVPNYLPTFQQAHFGRVYVAFGGVFIILSILWGWQVDKIAPDRFDIIGGLVSLFGVAIIMYWPRG
jgi:small multidrug resistance family-3 protein